MRTAGLAGDPAAAGSAPQLFQLVPLAEALSTRYPFDAMLAMYRIEGETRMPRLNKSALRYLVDKGAQVVADKVLLDVDNPGHTPWESEEQIAEAYAKVKATKLGATAGFYATRAGYRLIWLLAEPLPVSLLDSYLVKLIAEIAKDGIIADPACCDWTRLFRAPFATREGMTEPLNLPHDFEVGVLDFAPAGLIACRMPVRDTAIGAEWPHTPPAPSIPGPEDALPLKTAAPELYTALRKGKPIAARDAHNQTILRAVGLLAQGMAEPDPFAIYRALSQSVVLTYGDGGSGRTKDQALFDLWRAAKSMAATVLSERAANDREVAEVAAIVQRRRGSFAEVSSSEATGEEPAPTLDATAVDADGFPKDAILFTMTGAYYVLDWEETKATLEPGYRGPFQATAVPAMLQRYAPAIFYKRGIRNSKGTLISVPEMLTRCGGEIKAIHCHSGERGIRYDAVNKILHEGVAAVRADLTPRFDPQIDAFLRIFFRDCLQEGLDWLATAMRVSEPTCALYLHGGPGCGKTMIALGLASLYGSVPTMYHSIIGTHNDPICDCPIVLADEEVPASVYGKTPSADVRKIIGNTQHQLRRMYQPAASYFGSLRLVVTANNLDALKIHEDLTADDFSAIRQRFGYVRIPDAAGEYLRSIGGRQTTQAWIDGGLFARHLLWLAETRQVTPGSRFLVEGWDSPLVERLGAASGVTSAVIETIAFAISAKAGAVPLEGFLLGNGVIYVSPPAVFDTWEKAHGPGGKVPTKARVVSALRRLSTTPELVTVPYESGGLESELNAWPIRAKEVLQAIEDYQFGGTERVQQAIATALRWS